MTLSITSAQVHVHVIYLDAAPPSPKQLEILSADERQRARQFRMPLHADRFCIAHARLREILADYIARDPASLEFSYSATGKPSLCDSDVYFNLSHCDEIG